VPDFIIRQLNITSYQYLYYTAVTPEYNNGENNVKNEGEEIQDKEKCDLAVA